MGYRAPNPSLIRNPTKERSASTATRKAGSKPILDQKPYQGPNENPNNFAHIILGLREAGFCVHFAATKTPKIERSPLRRSQIWGRRGATRVAGVGFRA